MAAHEIEALQRRFAALRASVAQEIFPAAFFLVRFHSPGPGQYFHDLPDF
jgi:hypothetical protein